MIRLLSKCILRLMGATVHKKAKETMSGIEGSMSVSIVVLLVIAAGLFIFFGACAVRDPDPEDIAVGWGAIVIAAGMCLVAVHLLSYKIIAGGDCLSSARLLAKEKRISMKEPFYLEYYPEKNYNIVRQGKIAIKISWLLNGNPDFMKYITDHYDTANRSRLGPLSEIL